MSKIATETIIRTDPDGTNYHAHTMAHAVLYGYAEKDGLKIKMWQRNTKTGEERTCGYASHDEWTDWAMPERREE